MLLAYICKRVFRYWETVLKISLTAVIRQTDRAFYCLGLANGTWLGRVDAHLRYKLSNSCRALTGRNLRWPQGGHVSR